MQCSVNVARKICGEETANFTETYLRRTGDPLVRGQCSMNSYTSSECSSSLCVDKFLGTEHLIL
uniref:Uncharacterized protein n=1 Tax=Strigamia maritima TaxID=126957 RepID=T1JP26_STRMM